MSSLRVLCLGCLLMGAGTRVAAEEVLPAKIPPLSPRMEITPLPKPKPAPPPRKWTDLNKDLLPVALEALKDEDPEIHINAMRTLLNLGREAVPALVEALKGKDTELRVWSALILGDMGGEAREALPTLLAIVKDKKENRAVRELASRAVTHIVDSTP